MGRIDVVLGEELELRFRQEVAKSLGLKKGNISLAIEEAIKLWMESRKERRSSAAKRAWETRKK